MNSPARYDALEQALLVSAAGVAFLAFRIWLVERKLVDELQFRRRYTSRFINYYSVLAIIFVLSSLVLNLVVMISFPVLIVTVGWDVNFYRGLRTKHFWKKNKRWLVLERLTLHPPVVALALFIILTDAQLYIRAPNLVTIAVTAIFVYSPFFLVDERWRSGYQWPQALVVIGLFAGSTIAMMLAQALLWGVRLW